MSKKRVLIPVQLTEGELLAQMQLAGYVITQSFSGEKGAVAIIMDTDLQTGFDKLITAAREHILKGQ